MSAVVALTIAGSDSGGGAGIQADIKTFSALGVFATSVITAITAQNTQGVHAVEDVSPALIAAQIDAIFDDFDVGATKIGMVSRVETISIIAERLAARTVRPVMDPVMVATSGDRLLAGDAIGALRDELLPIARLVTPNLHEAALLTGKPVAQSEPEMIAQGEAILSLGADAVLVKGGHGHGPFSVDILVDHDGMRRFVSQRLPTLNTHGTGCTLASAITAGLARGLPLDEAMREAKAYLDEALAAGETLGVGRGNGPVHHFSRWWSPS